MDFTDNRTKKIIYLNHCLLNQDTRGPGAAFRAGASIELIQILLNNNLNIEQLPCLECLGAGGASRKSFNRFLPLMAHSIENGWSGWLKVLIKVRLKRYTHLCKKEARKVVDQMADFVGAGYQVIGVVGMNDSPTCGVTKTFDLIKSFYILAENIQTNIPVKKIIQDNLIDGRSYFIGSIIKELERRGMSIKVVGFEPWAVSQEAEAQRIAAQLNLEV